MTNKEMEEKWQSEDDARTLARTNEILSDPKRLSKAQKTASEVLNNLNKTIQSMTEVKNMKSNKMNDIIRGKK